MAPGNANATVVMANPTDGTVIAFMIYARFVDNSTGLDVAPQMWSDNFITLAPLQGDTLHCDLSAVRYPELSSMSLDLHVDVYNNVVGNGNKKIMTQKIPSSMIKVK